ncbi:hypothetical protein PtrM4_080360 [Pyrenophora tritici-repentis]|uniref:Uncharacterized protein n=1 Tax=Pyrenophora tritici-repentis TaxID=45151 RepID=A0A834RZE1_9PLEO|nr:hypothetical protein PtrM4_080360 [Pyrenophora tritici-repentis]
MKITSLFTTFFFASAVMAAPGAVSEHPMPFICSSALTCITGALDLQSHSLHSSARSGSSRTPITPRPPAS